MPSTRFRKLTDWPPRSGGNRWRAVRIGAGITAEEAKLNQPPQWADERNEHDESSPTRLAAIMKALDADSDRDPHPDDNVDKVADPCRS